MNAVKHPFKILTPGLHIKRWVVLGALGAVVFLLGLGVRQQVTRPGFKPMLLRAADWIIGHPLGIAPATLGLILTICGFLLFLFGIYKLMHSIVSILDPGMGVGDLVEVVYRKRKLTQGRRIVVIGGGTGLSTMLRGLKQYSANITAIVTVADDGGSSGKIKKQLGILPPGDIRNCLVALADSERQMTELFQYRFRNSVQPEKIAKPVESGEGYGEGLRDHAFGNLLIAAMCAINEGDFEAAVRETSRVLNIRGRVLPSTIADVMLRGEMEDGSTLDGETTIAHSPLKIKRVTLVPENPCPAEDVIEAIQQADIIVLGPGSVFTSIIPNLLVQGVADALRRSSAKKVYVCNVMTQPGETDGFSAYDHVHRIETHAGQRVFEYVLVNTGEPNIELLEKYRKVGSVLVEADTDRIRRDGYRPITGNFINESDVVRHNSDGLAKAIMKLIK